LVSDPRIQGVYFRDRLITFTRDDLDVDGFLRLCFIELDDGVAVWVPDQFAITIPRERDIHGPIVQDNRYLIDLGERKVLDHAVGSVLLVCLELADQSLDLFRGDVPECGHDQRLVVDDPRDDLALVDPRELGLDAGVVS
jgi:hypothetical protein